MTFTQPLQQVLGLDIDYPIIQAPVADVQDSNLTIAASKQGIWAPYSTMT